MRLSQDRIVLAAHVIAESAWVFALAGVVGVLGNLDSSPHTWFSIIGILGLSVFISRVSPKHGNVVEVLYFLVAFLGLTVTYLSVSVQVLPGEFKLGWPVDLIGKDLPPGYLFRGLLGGFIGLGLWWRGIRLAANEFPTDNLSFTFRVGMVVLVAALIYDLNKEEQLQTIPMVFLFFAAALGGLSAGHLLPESEQTPESKMWPKVIGATVVGITVVGLIVGLVNRGILSFFATPAVTALEALSRGVFWAIVAPIAFVFDVIVSWLISALGFFQDRTGPIEEGRVFNTEAEESLEQLQEGQEAAAEGLALAIQIIEWVLLAIVVLLVVLFLARAFRRLMRGRPNTTRGRRDSLLKEANPVSDVSRLLMHLVPDTLKRLKPKTYQVPDGPPDIVEVFRLYYDVLKTGEEQGISRRQQETPTEFQRSLERAIPSDIVRPSTEAFNLAFYANVPAEPGLIHRLSGALKNVAAAVGSATTRDQRESRQI